jgi:hypothetical protein
MIPEEQEEFNEEKARFCDANGESHQDVKNSDGGIENIVTEKLKAEEAVNKYFPKENSFMGYTQRPEDKLVQRYLSMVKNTHTLSEVVRELDDSPWYKKAWNKTKAFFSGKNYGQMVVGNKTKELDKTITEKQERYSELKREYQKERDNLKKVEQDAKRLTKEYDLTVAALQKNPDPLDKLKERELMNDIEYQNEVKSMAQTKLRNYEPQLERLGYEILGLRKTKLHLDRFIESADSGKEKYSFRSVVFKTTT